MTKEANEEKSWTEDDEGKPGKCKVCGKDGHVRLHPFSLSAESIIDYDVWDVWCDNCHYENCMDV